MSDSHLLTSFALCIVFVRCVVYVCIFLPMPPRWADRAVEIGRIVEKSIRESKAVDTESLCIVPGEKVRVCADVCEFLLRSCCV